MRAGFLFEIVFTNGAPYFSRVLSSKQPCQPSEPIRIVTVRVSHVCSALAIHLVNKHLESLWNYS